MFFLPVLFTGSAMMLAVLIGSALGIFGPYIGVAILGSMVMTSIIILRWDELAATIVIAVHVYVDWYLGLHLIAPLMVLGLLVIFYLMRVYQHPWIEPRALWLWMVFLVLTIPAAIQGALMVYDAASYYPSDILGAFLIFWLGIVIARDKISVRRFCTLLSALGVLLALHTLIQAMTGILLFGTSHYNATLANTSNYLLAGAAGDAHRVGSFFVDPNWNGSFLGMMLFLPLGLFVETSSFSGKMVYLGEMVLMVLGLLFTFSAGAWVATAMGMLVFVVLVGRMSYRILIPLLVGCAAAVLFVGFPGQVNILLQHATDPSELLLRNSAWQTAIRVMLAFPLTGVGLGYLNYQLRSDAFRVPGEFVLLSHPHNSYLEWGAMAGIPVLVVFLALLIFALWLALRNWVLAEKECRALLGGGIASVVTLSVNSWSINGWTLPALAMVGWLILGVVSSPLLRKSFKKMMQARVKITNHAS